MYPSPESKQENNEIDEDQTYCTSATISTVGRAVAIDLSDAMLPGDEKHKHMTIFFRKGGKWSDQELAALSAESTAWITKRFGLNAPVTFTISRWGAHSVLVKGDLESLCLYLRSKFAAQMCPKDNQREPHVALFRAKGGKGGRGRGGGGRGRGRGRGRRSNEFGGDHKKERKEKTCRMCGKAGHMKKECPLKDMKVQDKLQSMIGKVQQIKAFKQQEVQLLDEQETQLLAVLSKADNSDAKTINNDIKSIARAFKLKLKEMKALKPGKRGKGGRGRGRGGGAKRGKFGKRGDGKKKGGKGDRKERKERKQKKGDRKADKQEQRELKQQRKMEKKQEREERKRLKQEKKQKLEAARLDSLPSKADIGGNDALVIYVDGYNIIGCDSVCRKNMRGRGGGMKKSRTRIATLLQQQFVNRLGAFKLDYNVIVHLWFDGNGKDEQFGDIQIAFSSKKQIVDDKLVEKFSKNAKKDNANILVVTSDRELTLRLTDIGVKVMKSGTFYKSFLKEEKEQQNDDKDNNNDDEKEMVDTQEDEFVMIMAKKLNQSAAGTDNDEDEMETPGADSGDHTDDGEETPDEVEGGNPTDEEDYSEGGDNDDDDEEFTAIFGEDYAPDFDQQ